MIVEEAVRAVRAEARYGSTEGRSNKDPALSRSRREAIARNCCTEYCCLVAVVCVAVEVVIRVVEGLPVVVVSAIL